MKHIKTLLLMALAAITMAGCSSMKEVSQAEIARHNLAVKQLQAKEFVFKADRLTLDKRTFPAVSASTNFVMVDGDNATVQVTPGISGGPNGIGGFTVKGTVTGYEAKVKSNGAVSVKFYVTASVGSCSVYINLPKNSTRANVTVNNTLRGKNAQMYGEISGIDNSVFVGRSPY